MSNRATHTAGPWRAKSARVICVPMTHKSHSGGVMEFEKEVALIQPVRDRDERMANARLVAAAPDLLRAASVVLSGLNARVDAAPDEAKPVFDGIAELSAAVRKARGAQ